VVALLGVLLLWGVRDYEHRRAVNALQSRIYDGADPIRASAYPNWLNPFRWNGVVETQDFFATMQVNSSTPEVDPEGRMRIRPKPEENASHAGREAELPGPRVSGLGQVSYY